MRQIPENCLQKLRSRSLFVSKPWPSNHVWPNNVLVGKPVNIPGNSIPGYRDGFESKEVEVEFDAPSIRLWFDGEVWLVLAEEYCPGPGPGDFLDDWKTPEEAVEDILDFYFGDPKRMQAKADARKRTVQKSDKGPTKKASA
jgi:hypothetical protein